MNASERAAAQAIAEQAKAWFITNREREPSAEQQREFLAWLQASPVHVREYLIFAKLAVELRAAIRSLEVPLAGLVEAARHDTDDNIVAFAGRASTQSSWTDDEFMPRAMVCRTSRMPLLAAAVGTVAVAVLGWWLVTQMPLHKQYRTVHGEQRIVRLDDGSVLHINSDSNVRVAYTGTGRDIVMKHGQALFQVAEDETRPFRVRVGNTQVVAVGTEFDVRRVGDDVLVTVVQGSVAITKLAMAASDERRAAQNPVPLQLTAGQQARLADGPMSTPPAVLAVQGVDVRPAVAWAEQKIMFEHETLQNVAAEFNRYGGTQLTIEDAQIATLRISGIFRAYDLESFVLYLESLNGLQVQRDLDRIRISLRNPEGDAM